MQKLLLIFGTTLLFTACNNNTSTDTKEPSSVVSEIKDAIVNVGLKSVSYETETLMPEGMGTSTSKVIMDDFGNKTRTESTTSMSFGGKSMSTIAYTLLIDGYAYSWSNMSNSGNKYKVDKSKFDPNNIDASKLTEEMRQKMNYKDEGSETVNGKDCKVASFTMEQMKGKVWTWKQVPVKMEMSMMGKVITTNVKNIEENPNIPAGTFDVPSNIQFKEMNVGKPTADK